MNILKAMEDALEALEQAQHGLHYEVKRIAIDAITNLRAAIEEVKKAENIVLPEMPAPKEVLMFDEAVEVKGFSRSQMREYAIAAIRVNLK